jgi:serine/threonine-protein kinase RsbW
MLSTPQTPRRQEGSGLNPCREPWREQALQTFAEIGAILDDVLAAMTAAGYPEKDQFAVRLALDEALANGIKHGNRHDPGKWVWLRYRVTAEAVLAEVEDQGPGFNPGTVPNPLAPENLERFSGRGLFLMRAYMTWVRHNERGNCITLCKDRSAA